MARPGHSWAGQIEVRLGSPLHLGCQSPSLEFPVPHRTPPNPHPSTSLLQYSRAPRSSCGSLISDSGISHPFCVSVLPGFVHLHLPPFPQPHSIGRQATHESDPVTESLRTPVGPDALASYRPSATPQAIWPATEAPGTPLAEKGQGQTYRKSEEDGVR